MAESARAYRRDPEAKRERLLAAAQSLFASQGFDATTTVQIAREAGVSEGILFHHFGSKRGLFVALAERYAASAASATMPDDGAELTEETVVRSAFAFADAHPGLYDMMSKAAGELSVQEIDAQSEVLVEAIRNRLTLAMKQGRVRMGDAGIMARLQFAVVDGAYRAWRREGDPSRREAYINEAIACMKAMLSA